MNSAEYFTNLILPLQVTLCLPDALSLAFYTLFLYPPHLSPIFNIFARCAFNPLSVCFDPILNSRVHFCK